MRIVPLPLLGNLQNLFCAANFLAVQQNPQTFRRILYPESVLFPGEGPIEPVRFSLGVRFLRKKIPVARRFAQLRNQKILRRFLRRVASRLRSSFRFRNLVFVTGDVAFRTYADLKLFLLLRLEKPHIPVPHIDFRGHQSVGFFQSNLPLEIRFRVIVHSKNDHRPESVHALAQGLHKTARARKRFSPWQLEVDRRLWKRVKKMPVRIPEPHDSRKHP